MFSVVDGHILTFLKKTKKQSMNKNKGKTKELLRYSCMFCFGCFALKSTLSCKITTTECILVNSFLDEFKTFVSTFKKERLTRLKSFIFVAWTGVPINVKYIILVVSSSP